MAVEDQSYGSESGSARPELQVSDELSEVLRAVAIVDGHPAQEHLDQALSLYLAQIVLRPQFAGEFADACADYDAANPDLQADGSCLSTHSTLASSVMQFRARMREQLG